MLNTEEKKKEKWMKFFLKNKLKTRKKLILQQKRRNKEIESEV